jgi:Polyketide cyclase / dehydrase and lipid transport
LHHLALPSPELQDSKDEAMNKHITKRNFTTMTQIAALGALAFLSVNVSPAFAATLSRSVDVSGTLSAVWSMIGPFCAIKDWLPPVGTCTENGASPPERTLVTRDGKATFVETQTARSDAEHSYSYTFKSSPLPVTGYASTIKVVPKSDGVSTVIWSSTYVPDPGKEQAAREALTGIYEAGLATIKAKFAK